MNSVDIILDRDDLKKQLAPQKQTSGVITVFDETKQVFICYTLELAWRENKSNVSCVPKGLYKFKIVERSGSFKYPHLHITKVPNRSGIKAHIVNFVRQLRGCVGVGYKFQLDIDNDGLIDVQDSRKAIEALIKAVREVLGERKFGYIEIIDNFTKDRSCYE